MWSTQEGKYAQEYAQEKGFWKITSSEKYLIDNLCPKYLNNCVHEFTVKFQVKVQHLKND